MTNTGVLRQDEAQHTNPRKLMVAVPTTASSNTVVSLNAAELHNLAVEHRGLRGSSSIREMKFITTMSSPRITLVISLFSLSELRQKQCECLQHGGHSGRWRLAKKHQKCHCYISDYRLHCTFSVCLPKCLHQNAFCLHQHLGNEQNRST